MPGADNGAVILVVECGTAEVDEVDLRTQQHSSELCRSCRQCAGGWNVPIVGESLVCVAEQQNVLRLQVGVDQIQVVQECNGSKELPCEGLNVRSWEGDKATALQEVEDRQPEKRRNDADVASPVEAVAQLDASILVVFVGGSKGLEYSKLDAASIAILIRVRKRKRDQM